jgi:hypothetical protein
MPQISQEMANLVIRFKEENTRWGYQEITDQLVYLKYSIGKSKVYRDIADHILNINSLKSKELIAD